MPFSVLGIYQRCTEKFNIYIQRRKFLIFNCYWVLKIVGKPTFGWLLLEI